MAARRRKKPSPKPTPPEPPESRPPGRPTKLTPELAQRIVAAIRAGSYIEEAAESVGIHRSTVFLWLEKGREGEDELHGRFFDAVERARAEDAVRDLALITRAATQPQGTLDWRAAAWKRERKDPARWGQKVRITLTEELEGFLDDLQRILPAEWYEKALEAAAARLGGAEARGAEGVASAGASDAASAG
jgi:hypothetical protein